MRRSALMSPKNTPLVRLQFGDTEILHCDSDCEAAVGDRVAVELSTGRWSLGVVTRVFRPQARTRYAISFDGGATHTLPRDWHGRVARVCVVERIER